MLPRRNRWGAAKTTLQPCDKGTKSSDEKKIEAIRTSAAIVMAELCYLHASKTSDFKV